MVMTGVAGVMFWMTAAALVSDIHPLAVTVTVYDPAFVPLTFKGLPVPAATPSLYH